MAVQLTLTWRRVAAWLALVAVLPLAAYGLFALVRPDRSLTSAVDRDRFQAVVLSSGVVYFGHLRESDGDFYELRDAFFIQEVKKPGATSPTRSVLPLKQELHGPENRMLIPRGQVVSVENLRADSPVTKAAESQPK